MAETKKEDVLKALSFVIEPDLGKDIVTLNLVEDIRIDGDKIQFKLKVNNPSLQSKKRLQDACEHQLNQKLKKKFDLAIMFEALPKSKDREVEQRSALPGVKHVIAISSGKGGVGKSTITANLAVGLSQQGYKVGLIDADIYGPSMPLMFDVLFDKPKPVEVNGKPKIAPVESYGVKLMSIGFFAGINDAVVWRGPMASKALEQMINDVEWGELDIMLLDLPPGTGDVHLTLVQAAPLSGAIVVSTPQPVALADARKGVSMFRLESINIPVVGIIENMSYFVPPDMPDKKYYIFGMEGARDLAGQMKVPFLGEIPLVQGIREAGDVGRPAVLQDDSIQEKAFEDLIAELTKNIGLKKSDVN